MDTTPGSNRVKPGFPVITAMVAGAAALVFLSPPLQSLLTYDRARILDGEVWRIVTGHWVHFSASHFVYDTLAFVIAGWIIESRGLKHFGRLCLIAATLTGLALLVCEPQFSRCGGLSGMATAAVVFLALDGLRDRGAWRWVCFAALVALAAKLFAERFTQRLLLVEGGSAMVPATTSHVAGVMAAAGVYFLGRMCGRTGVNDLSFSR